MNSDIKETLRKRLILTLVTTGIALPLSIGLFVSYFILGSFAKANIRVEAGAPTSIIHTNWKGYAQGGEEIGVRMLEPVVPQLKALQPQFVRIDHVYDFYDVVKRDGAGHLVYNWQNLDNTVCDIYQTGAKPFFALGYMPNALSSDGSLISPPNNWNEWAAVVRATVERYSGANTSLCNGTVSGSMMGDVHYEVWNEPDLEQFGKWSIYGGEKSYKNLYYYAAYGAASAQDTLPFALGGPGTTAPYRNWMQTFMQYVQSQHLRLDFLSWHKYTDKPDDYGRDLADVKKWLTAEAYPSYFNVPQIITEWGIDSNPTDAYNQRISAAHTVASVEEMIHNNLSFALAFEPVDGPQSTFGIIDRSGHTKPRYEAFKILNQLESSFGLTVSGETDHVRVIAGKNTQSGAITLILSNYDKANRHEEEVPITIAGLAPGVYRIFTTTLGLPRREVDPATIVGNEEVLRSIYMLPNDVSMIELVPSQ
jgi:hypothetical protein